MSARRIVNDIALIAAERDYRAGIADWVAVQRAQDAMMPCCEAHGRATPMVLDGVPLCADCLQERGGLRLELKAHQLVSGGLERQAGV